MAHGARERTMASFHGFGFKRKSVTGSLGCCQGAADMVPVLCHSPTSRVHPKALNTEEQRGVCTPCWQPRNSQQPRGGSHPSARRWVNGEAPCGPSIQRGVI